MTDREKELVRLVMKLREWVQNDPDFDEEARELIREIDATIADD